MLHLALNAYDHVSDWLHPTCSTLIISMVCWSMSNGAHQTKNKHGFLFQVSMKINAFEKLSKCIAENCVLNINGLSETNNTGQVRWHIMCVEY